MAVASPIFLLVSALCWLETGTVFFIQRRVGKNEAEFSLIKFRTMKLNTPELGTHEIDTSYLTRNGKFFRRMKIDELPQLLNVIKGDMSFVGPRPNLTGQSEVIAERRKRGVYQTRPGITGLSQLNNIDMSKPSFLAKTDALMIKNQNHCVYLKYIFLTLVGKGIGDKVKQKN